MTALAGCQTVNQSTTPALYEIQKALSSGVQQFCIVGGSGSGEKIRNTNTIHRLEIAKDMSGWIRATAKNSVQRVEGKFYYNPYTNQHRCAGYSIPENLPQSWRAMSESEASIVLNKGELPASELRKKTNKVAPKLF